MQHFTAPAALDASGFRGLGLGFLSCLTRFRGLRFRRRRECPLVFPCPKRDSLM